MKKAIIIIENPVAVFKFENKSSSAQYLDGI